MKKAAITGHTSGIGAALSKVLYNSGYEIQGFSRKTGYDLSQASTINKIVENCQEASLFINNAFYEWAQIDLLYRLFESWKTEDKIIINISSNSSDGIKNFVHKYAVQKGALDMASLQLSNIPNTKCKIINIRPGWVRTPRIEKLNIQAPMLEAQDLGKLISLILELPPNMQIPSLKIKANY
jgi:NADP-dependent 3-hydroxy acid dehydrogenase YdfG